MGRKGKNLFELLQMRATGTVPAPSARSGSDVVADVRDRVEGWLDRIRGRSGRRRSGRGARAPRGIWAAAVILGCVGVGFALGRLTERSAGGGDLRAPMHVQPPGELLGPTSPRREEAGRATDLSADEEVATLSNFFFVIWIYKDDGHGRGAASHMAYHLRQHGVDTARIKWWPPAPEKASAGALWVVLVYVAETTEDAASVRAPAVLAALRGVPALDRELGLRDKLQGLAVENLKKRESPR